MGVGVGVGAACHPAAFEQVSKKGQFGINGPVASKRAVPRSEMSRGLFEGKKNNFSAPPCLEGSRAGIFPLTEHFLPEVFLEA